jgi:EmrB/QacA subfamily drug resistance transporter
MSTGITQERSASASAIPDPRRWKALALLCAAFFMVILDSAIVVVALPSIEQDVGFSTGTLQWVLSAYLLSFGGLLLLGGRAGDLLGRRRMFIAGSALFGVASLGVGLAWSEGVLIAARVVQGMAAAAMVPTALAILMTTFDDGAERTRAIGIWTATGATAATAAWLVGGPITSGLGWEWIFFINLPVAVGVVALGPLLLRESSAAGERRVFDLAGATTITAALVLLVYAVVEAPEAGWADRQTIGLLAAAAALVGLFVAVETRSSSPLVPLRIFRSRTLVGGNLVMLANGMLVYGMSFILTLYAQQVLDFSPSEFGLGSAVMAAGSAIAASTIGPVLVTRFGFRPVATAGLTLMGLGSLLLSQVSVNGTYWGDMFLGLLVFGPGIGSAHLAATVATLERVDEADSGLASGLSNASFQIGAALGVAILTSVAVSQTAGPEPLAALTEGFRSAFVAAIVFAALGIATAAALLGNARRPRSLETQPALAAAD